MAGTREHLASFVWQVGFPGLLHDAALVVAILLLAKDRHMRTTPDPTKANEIANKFLTK